MGFAFGGLCYALQVWAGRHAGAAEWAAEIRSKTLGQTRDKLVGSLFRSENHRELDSNETHEATASSDTGHFAFQQHMVMPQEAHAQFMEDTNSLLVLRNELVHHLLEKHDLESPRNL